MYKSIGGDIGKYSLTSMYNYLYSIRSLLKSKNYQIFKHERVAHYSTIKLKQINLTRDNKRYLFEQFFFAYKLMNNLKSITEQNNDIKIPLVQLAGIALYYASYSLVNCFNYIHNKTIQKNHTKTCRTFNCYCEILSFPFNLTGKYVDGSCAKFDKVHGREEYPDSFNYENQALRNRSLDRFDYKSAILAYLKGTHRFYWENSHQLKDAKKEIRNLGLSNFRSTRAREVRDRFFNIIHDTNYLSCLFRLRGKVNYRDSIFSLYELKPEDGYNSCEKAILLPNIMLEILKYFSLDVESYFIRKLYQNKFYEKMLVDIIEKTSIYNLEFPKFQRNLFYSD